MRNMLDRKTARVLEDWLLDHKEEIERGKWAKATISERLSKTVGRPILTSNVVSAAEAVDVHFPTTHKGNHLKSLHQLSACVRVLAKEIDRLGGEMGLVVSPEVKDLAGIE